MIRASFLSTDDFGEIGLPVFLMAADRLVWNLYDKKRFTAKKMTLGPVSEWLAGEVCKSFWKHYPI